MVAIDANDPLEPSPKVKPTGPSATEGAGATKQVGAEEVKRVEFPSGAKPDRVAEEAADWVARFTRLKADASKKSS